MHPELKTAIELQQVDLKITELNAQINDLPDKIKALEAHLNQFIQAHEELKKRLSADQKERRELEGDIQPIQARIAKHKDQLYEVKTNEQYRAMLKEIEGEEANIRKIEDQILERMLEAEDLQKKIQEAGARLESETAHAVAEQARLESARGTALEGRERLETRRKELQATLTEDVRNLYTRVAKARHGLAVAEVREGFCTACNVRLRPQLYNEVRTSQVVLTCDNCSRILYYVEPEVAAENHPEGNDARAAL